jgi:hypothetical protein
MAEKTHVSYPKDLRADAKARGLGLVTVHIAFPDGEQREYQLSAEPHECRFAAWAGALLKHPRIRPLPDLEALVRERIESEIPT